MACEWGCEENLIGTCSDTASTNLGNKSGAATILEQKVGHPLLKLECQRHVRELHVKYYGISISGRNTKGVGDQLFNKIRDHWDEIIANGIDYQKLELFDWNQDEFLVQKARDSLELMEKLLDSDSEMFHRGDYKSLAMLVRVYLTGDIHKFRFSKPIKTSHARFLQKGIYYVTAELLSEQLEFLHDEEYQEIAYMAEFVALFYAPWFLKSSLSADSPLNDLDIIDDIRKLRDSSSDDPRIVIAAEACLESIYRHSRYLHPQLVVMALASDKVTSGEKKAIAEALMAVKDQFDVKKVVKDYTKFDVMKIWPDINSRPSLAEFVTKDSWLMFHLLDLMNDPDHTEWLSQDVKDWRGHGHDRFVQFVRNVDVVNDCSERAVKLCQDFLDTTTKEDTLQNRYHVVDRVRRLRRSRRKNKDSLKLIPTGVK